MSFTRDTTTAPPPPAELRAAYATAKGTWPGIALSFEQFHSCVARFGNVRAAVPAYPADLYLCAACESGQGIAYQTIEAVYFPALKPAIYRVVGDRPAVEDVLQDVRTRLFVGCKPKIATYQGSGALGGWLRAVAVHASRDYHRAKTLERGRLRKLAAVQRLDGRAAMSSLDAPDSFRPIDRLCERAWNHAIFSLGSEDRRLLYYYFVSGLSIDRLGPIYSVHRATIARRICRAKGRVRRCVRKTLSEHCQGLTAQDLDALVLQTHWDPNLSATLFGPDTGAAAA